MGKTVRQNNRFVFTEPENDDQAGQADYKQCIFCAETIRADAFKCRLCGEFLNTDKARALEQQKQAIEAGEYDPDRDPSEKVLFSGRPSLFGLISPAIKSVLLLAGSIFLFNYPLEDDVVVLLDKFTDFQLSDGQYYAFAQWRQIITVGLAILILLIFVIKVMKLKMTYYEVTPERVEHSRGIFDRRVDNLDMFRVVDLKMRRSILDCMLGIGQVTLLTNDKTDPEFTFRKIRRSRKLYDVIKKASLAADKDQGVVHLE